MMNAFIHKLKYIRHSRWFGNHYLTHPTYLQTQRLIDHEATKQPLRSEIINHLLKSVSKSKTIYLEIGVRNPEANYDKIHAAEKYGVDPGLEFVSNPVKFKLTSDKFFQQLQNGELLQPDLRFDLVFVDGLHTAEQTWRDIENALKFLTPEGFVVLHDCNPPTEWHAREDFDCRLTPAGNSWNGTTWKAYLRSRYLPGVQSCCIDTDWGVGVLCRHQPLGQPAQPNLNNNRFYEYKVLDSHRAESLNLMTFEDLKRLVK